MVYGELGQVEIAVAIQQRMVVFWSRIILGKQSKISYIIYIYIIYIYIYIYIYYPK